jgi:hypothetical protein
MTAGMQDPLEAPLPSQETLDAIRSGARPFPYINPVHEKCKVWVEGHFELSDNDVICVGDIPISIFGDSHLPNGYLPLDAAVKRRQSVGFQKTSQKSIAAIYRKTSPKLNFLIYEMRNAPSPEAIAAHHRDLEKPRLSVLVDIQHEHEV